MSTEVVTVLVVARELAKGKTEAHWRSSASRAYYAAFHASSDWHSGLPAPGNPGVSKGEHQKLIQQLCFPSGLCSTDQKKQSRWLAGQLDTLRALRVRADYELKKDDLTFEESMLACGMAGQIIEKTSG